MKPFEYSMSSFLGEKPIQAWKDDTYCAIAYECCGAIHLTVNRLDMKDGISWDELQRIKNACGFEDRDAVEAYPRQRDVINTGNIRHLYVFEQLLPLITRAN